MVFEFPPLQSPQQILKACNSAHLSWNPVFKLNYIQYFIGIYNFGSIKFNPIYINNT